MDLRLGRERADLTTATPPPFTVGEIITRLNAIAALDDDGRKALATECKKRKSHIPTGEGHCWACGAPDA